MINWSSPSYWRTISTLHPITLARRPQLRCNICGERMRVGDRYLNGPRGFRVAHAECAATRVVDVPQNEQG